jgi:MFS family permease
VNISTQQSTSFKLYLLSLLQGIANGIWGFLSIFLLYIGGTAFELGLLATLPGLASTFMQLAWGRISDKLGRNWKMVAVGYLMTSLFSIPVLLSVQPWQIIVASGIQVFLGSIVGVAVTVRLAEILEPTRRARFMGIYNPMGFGGNIIGSFFAGLCIPILGYRYTFLGYTVLNLIIVGLIRFGFQLPDEQSFRFFTLLRSSFQELKSGLKELPLVARRGGAYTKWCIGISVRGFGISMFGPVSTIFLINVFFATEPQIGSLNSLAFTMRLIWAPILGYVADRFGIKRIMLTGFVLAALYPIFFASVKDVTMLVPVYMLNGFFWACINSSWFAWLVERVNIYVSAILSSCFIIAGFWIMKKVPENLE